MNNAGFEVHGSFFRHASSTQCDLVNVNVSAVVALSHAFGRAMAEQGRGGILFVSSVTHRPHAWYASYSASKAFISSFAAVLRAELKDKGVDVLALEPGCVESEMFDRMRETVNLERIGVPVISAEWCAVEGIKALIRGRSRWTPGFVTRTMMWMLSFVSDAACVWISSIVLEWTMDKGCFEYD